MENEIREVKLTLMDGRWIVEAIKYFAPEYGGGSQTFREDGGMNIHRALDVARGMVTMSPARRTEESNA